MSRFNVISSDEFLRRHEGHWVVEFAESDGQKNTYYEGLRCMDCLKDHVTKAGPAQNGTWGMTKALP